MTITDLEVREATAADHQRLLQFLMEAYPALGWSQAFMDWQYYQNPSGNARSWMAFDGEAVVANYTAVPHRMWVNERFTTGWRAQDVITHPDYRGLGLYAKLSDAAVKGLHVSAFPLNFTFPNENSHAGFIKRNWHNPNRIPLWSRQGVPDLGESVLQAQPLTRFGEREEAIWREACAAVSFAVDRSAAYLNWRYIDNPRGGYSPFLLSDGKAEALVILKIYKREGGGCSSHLMDYIAPPAFTAHTEVLRFWAAFARQHGADLMSLWSARGSLLTPLLTDAGFEFATGLTRWHVLNVNTSDPMLNEVADFTRWHFSMGDTDVF